MQLAPVGNLLGIERCVVMRGSCLDGVVLRREGLDDDLSAEDTPPSPSGYLAEELKSPLPGAEVGQVQAGIGTDDPHQGYRRYIQRLVGGYYYPDCRSCGFSLSGFLGILQAEGKAWDRTET